MDLESTLHAVQGVLSLCIITCIGYVLARKKWFSPESKSLLPRLVMVVSLPLYMLYHITHSFSHDDLIHLAHGLIVPLVSTLVVYGISVIIARCLRVEPRRRGIFCTGFTASNSIFIGLPVNIALFGESSLPYVLLYYFANTTFFWTVGNYLIASSGEAALSTGKKEPVFSRQMVKRIFSPPMLAFFVSVLLVLFGVKLPHFVMDTAHQVGNLTTPLILISLGVTFQSMRLRSIRVNSELVWLWLGRFIVSPVVVILLAILMERLGLPLPDLMLKVFIIQSSLPMIASSGVLASYYKSDEEFCTVSILSSTLLAIITIPLYMILLSMW